jgi:hypothetical protein
LLGLGGVIAIEMLNKAQALGSLNFYPGKAKSLSWDGATPIIKAELLAQNTSNKQFVINSIAGNIYTDNYLVGNVSQFNAINVPSNKQTVIILEFRLRLIQIANILVQAIQGQGFVKVVSTELDANVEGFPQAIPIDLQFKIGA